MRIIWASNYKSYSFNSTLGIFLILCVMAICIVAGFFAGFVYYKTSNVNEQLTPIIMNDPTNQIEKISSIPTTQHKQSVEKAITSQNINVQINVLAEILSELKAKLVTLENLNNEFGQNVFVNTQGLDFKMFLQNQGYSSNSAMGGRYESALDAISQSHDHSAHNLVDLLKVGSSSLEDALTLESKLLRSKYKNIHQEINDFFSPSIIPSNARVSSRYGIRVDPLNFSYAMHRGVDFAAVVGTPIYAIAAGVVEFVKHKGDFGRHLEITHQDNISSLYAHCSKIIVKPGEFVQKGQLIAYIGASGRVSGPHLHLEIRVNGEPVDPERFIDVNSYVASRKK